MRDSMRLLLITLIAGLLLGGTYELTKEPIAQQRLMKANAALLVIFPEATSFEEVDTEQMDESARPLAAFKVLAGEASIGAAVRAKGEGGYRGAVEVVVGFAADGSVIGVQVGQNDETKGIGTRAFEPAYLDQFVGNAASDIASGSITIDAVSGATLSSNAVKDGVTKAAAAYNQLAEGGVQ